MRSNPGSEKEKVVSPEHAAATVLVVEDNKVAAVAVSLELKSLNCTVEIAKNGAEALEKTESNTDDLILMDIGLPDIDGIEVTKKIRALSDARKSRVPIVAWTGHAGGLEQ